MQAYLQRRRDGQPGPAAEEPAGPPPTALLLPHHAKAKSASLLGVAAADWGAEGDGMGAGSARGRGRGSALKWAALSALALLLLLRYRPEGSGHMHTSFVTVEGTQVGRWGEYEKGSRDAARAYCTLGTGARQSLACPGLTPLPATPPRSTNVSHCSAPAVHSGEGHTRRTHWRCSLPQPLSCLQFMLDCRPFYIAGFNLETIGQLAHRDFAGDGAALRSGATSG